MSMHRWLAIVLLAFLPFQFSWAAVASYCGHESDAQAQHLGHHEHQHHGQAATDEDAGGVAGKALGSTDFDCGHCHGTCSALPALDLGLTPLAVASPPHPPRGGSVRTLSHSPPERPQWAALA